MPRASNACSLAIVKAPRLIGLFALRAKRSSNAPIFYFLMTTNFSKRVQVEV